MSLIEGIYIDFTVVAAAATVVDRLQNPALYKIIWLSEVVLYVRFGERNKVQDKYFYSQIYN